VVLLDGERHERRRLPGHDLLDETDTHERSLAQQLSARAVVAAAPATRAEPFGGSAARGISRCPWARSAAAIDHRSVRSRERADDG
jgi:hypothetical protein